MNPADVIDGRYRLERVLGSGGMAEVWLAEDTRLGRWVAVKILLTLSGDDLGSSLQDEARVIASLHHQNIVAVYDAGEVNGRHYVVLEYVDGTSLRDLLSANGPFSEAEATRIAGQVAAALQYAHQQGILHGDIKPENILVTSGGVAKLADFGTAEAINRTLSPEQAREVLGTIAYLAPEVLQGSPATPAADVYSLGLTTYEMVAGRLPFSGASPAAIAAQRLSSPAPPLRTVVPAASVGLERALAAAVAIRPLERPQSAGQFAGALREATARNGNPTARTQVQAPPPPPPMVTRTAQRRANTGRVRPAAPVPSGPNVPMLVAAIAVVIFGLGAAGVGAYILATGGGDDDDGNPTPTPTTAPVSQTTEPSATATKPPATQAATATPSPSPSATPSATATKPAATATATPPAATATRTPTPGPATATATKPPATATP